MSITTTIFIHKSVGAGGRNDANDVRAVQKQLNDQSMPPRQMLVVDGKAGPKTAAMIRDFQSVVLGVRNPDGRVDPNGRTLAALNAMDSQGKWARMSVGAPAAPAAPGTVASGGGAGALLEQQARKTGDLSTYQEVQQFVVNSALPPLKTVVAGITTADQARILLDCWKFFRSAGFSAADTARTIGEIKRMNPQFGVDLLGKLAEPGSRFAQRLSTVTRYAGGAGLVIGMLEIGMKFRAAKYAEAIADCYKLFMGIGLPWAGLVEALQSVVQELLPGSAKNSMVFQVLRALDPIGHGAAGVDAVVTLAIGLGEMISRGEMQPGRLEQLVARFRSGPGGVLARMGDELGDSLHEISRWRRDDLTYAVRSIPGFIRSFLP